MPKDGKDIHLRVDEPSKSPTYSSSHANFVIFHYRSLGTIAQGVDFDTIAREWRCKWSQGNDKKSLVEAQIALKDVLAEIKAVDGFLKVDRVVCGGCMDFKVREKIKQ